MEIRFWAAAFPSIQFGQRSVIINERDEWPKMMTPVYLAEWGFLISHI